MKILLDANLSPAWVETLAASGFYAIHWSTIGAGDAPDFEIMAFARENNFTILTRDLDFGKMLASNRQDRPSVVQIRVKQASPRLIGPQVIEALHSMKAEVKAGALITIDLKRARLRILPIR